jgi:hypothetical protein
MEEAHSGYDKGRKTIYNFYAYYSPREYSAWMFMDRVDVPENLPTTFRK